MTNKIKMARKIIKKCEGKIAEAQNIYDLLDRIGGNKDGAIEYRDKKIEKMNLTIEALNLWIKENQ